MQVDAEEVLHQQESAELATLTQQLQRVSDEASGEQTLLHCFWI